MGKKRRSVMRKDRNGEWVLNKDAKSKLAEFADDLWSLAVKEDWLYACAICGKTDRDVLNSHHLLSRKNYGVRFDLNNGICLCRYCHVMCPKRSPHDNGPGFQRWLEQRHPHRKRWLDQIQDEGYEFKGTKNWVFYVEVIKDLQTYIPDDKFADIVGKRFAQWLEEY